MNKSDIVSLLSCTGITASELYNKADALTRSVYGSDVFIRGIIEFSNRCVKNCKYCGIRRDSIVNRYEMDFDTIMFLIKDAHMQGYKTVVLQSGEYMPHDEMIEDIITETKRKYDIVLTLSLGERDESVYRRWKSAGADRYLMRIETTNRNIFKSLHPDDDFDNRLEALTLLKKTGFETGTGIMLGLPGQTDEDLANDLIFFKKYDFDMLGVGPFIPHHDTPMADLPVIDAEKVKNFVALMRLITENTNIPATTSMGTLQKNLRAEILNCGANVIMPNHTPIEFREQYMLYDNKIGVYSEPEDTLHMALNDIESAGKTVCWDKGYRKKVWLVSW